MRSTSIRNIFIGLILLILVITVFLLLRNFRSLQQQTSTAQGVVITTPQRITDASASIKYKIDVTYPSFSGLSDSETEKVINSMILQEMEQAILEFKDEVNQTEQNLINVPPAIQNAINEFYITFKVIRADDKIISVQFSIMDYQAGMDHPNNYNMVFNYDVPGKRILTTADVFNINSDYLTVLSNLTKEQLQTRFKDNPYAGDFINEGTAPKAENFQLFTVGTGTLNIIFNPYQVAPYYAGTQIVSVPYGALSGVLSPTFSR